MGRWSANCPHLSYVRRVVGPFIVQVDNLSFFADFFFKMVHFAEKTTIWECWFFVAYEAIKPRNDRTTTYTCMLLHIVYDWGGNFLGVHMDIG